jgi:hypothetical protein
MHSMIPSMFLVHSTKRAQAVTQLGCVYCFGQTQIDISHKDVTTWRGLSFYC